MSAYDFSTLNSYDFELLVRDLLNAKEASSKSGIEFRTYKEGKDKGIDLLYATPANPYQIVGQVKHYLQSGVNQLLRDLEATEVAKVIKLNPGRYIFATSVPLTIGKTDDILELFKPYIKSTADIADQAELNRLIGLYPRVLENHFKLWFSGADVLNKLLNFQVEGRSREFSEFELKKKLRLYVKTSALDKAREVLEKNKFVVITGEPGIGKTTTAELLVYEAMNKGYKLVYIYDDIKEAEQDLNKLDEKTVFYFDDFLGHNALEIARARGTETALLSALRRVTHSENKLFIFTTRTSIMQAAVLDSERLRNFNIKAKESSINISDYGNQVKEQLLNNHAEESNIAAPLKKVLEEQYTRLFIINHPNFSPRSIEFITTLDKVGNMSADKFRDFIHDNFDKPDQIWQHAYEQQIGINERLLLNTMLSFGDSVHPEDLKQAFNSRLDYEVKHNNFTKPLRAFYHSFKNLEGGFIVNDRFNSDNFSFLNHSLVDFLIHYVKSDYDEVLRMSESALFVVQLITRLYPLGERNNRLISPGLKSRLLTDSYSFIRHSDADADRVNLAMMLFYYTTLSESEILVHDLFNSVEDWGFIEYESNVKYNLVNWLKNIDNEDLIAVISLRSNKVFFHLVLSPSQLDDCIELLTLAEDKFDLSLVIQFDELERISEYCSELLDQKIDEDVEDLLTYTNAQDFVDEKEEESEDIKRKLESFGLDIKSNLSKYNEHDWYEVGIQNYFNEQMQKDD